MPETSTALRGVTYFFMNYLIFFSGAAFGCAFLFVVVSLVVIFSKKMTAEQRQANERVETQLKQANHHREFAANEIGRLVDEISELVRVQRNK